MMAALVTERPPSVVSPNGDRARAFDRLKTKPFDLLVVGGGITGAAVAREASVQGLRVALIEQADFASGTSGRSSRLIHGGLKYLGQGKVGLVYHSLREQQRLSQIAPHLVQPLDLLFPFDNLTLKRHVGYRAGLAAYKLMQPRMAAARHSSLSTRETLLAEPLLRGQGLTGGFVCREYLTHDARLVWEIVLAAKLLGACVINYAKLVTLLMSRNRVGGALVRDDLTGREIEVRAQVVVNATGPWSDHFLSSRQIAEPRLRLTKGVHIIVPRARLPISQGVIFFSPLDRKPLVAIPIDNYVLAGPTETEYSGDPNDVGPDREAIEYLLESLANFFSKVALETKDVVGARAGLRPLYNQPARPAGQVSRAYRIEWQREGLLSIFGGKLTLHREAAHFAMKAISPKVKSQARARPSDSNEVLPGARWTLAQDNVRERLQHAGLEPDSINHIVRTYGSRSAIFPELFLEIPHWRTKIVKGLPHVWAEVAFAIRHEMATVPSDFLERRTDLAVCAMAEGTALPAELNRTWNELVSEQS
jgi:glycerol-3-phosphate dehydrogenase